MKVPTPLKSNVSHHLGRRLNILAATTLLLCAAGELTRVHAEAVSDIVVGYTATWRAGMGGTDQVNAAIYNQITGANNIAAASGSPHRQNVVGTKESAHDFTGQVDCGAMIGLMANYDSSVIDLMSYADNLGADQVAYIGDMYDNGAAAQAQQPGRYSCYEQAWWWQNVAAHESGGHNFNLDHRDGVENPKTIMLHNYCGGGSNPYYSNPNIWLNGIKLLGIGSCLGGTAGAGGDNTYMLSTTAQGRSDAYERRVWGSYRGAITYRWQFTNSPGPAPAGTVITDEVSSAQAIVRGQGATFTGTALRLPGGTTANTAADSIAAYLDLPNGIFSAMPSFTIEIWAAPLSAQNYMRVIDIGRTTEAGDGLGVAGEWTGTPGSPAPGSTSSSDDLMLSACIGTDLNSQRFEAKLDGGSVQTADSGLGTTAGELHHYAITFADTASGGTIKWFRDGGLVKTLNVTFHSASLEDVNNWLGRSLWSGDSLANMDYYDVRIQSLAIADAEVAANYRIGPNDKTVTMWASDAWNSSGFTSGAWEFGQSTPDANHDYETGTLLLRTPHNAISSSFPGRSLTISGGQLHLNATAAKTTTINDLRLNGGTIGSFGDNNSVQTLAGNITVMPWAVNQIRGGWGPMIISAKMSGLGIMEYTENAVTLTGNNTNFTGQTIIGDGRFSTLNISSEANLGGNPPYFGGDWLTLNRGILVTTATMAITNANRGIRIGPSGGFLNPAAGTTLTIATPISSPAAGNTLQTSPLSSNPTLGIFFKDGAGVLELTSPNNSHNAEMQILAGELRLTGNGRINNGSHSWPVTINALFTDNSAMDQTFSGVISGNGTIVKTNSSTLNLNGANTFSGSVAVNGGTLYANPGNAANNRALSFASSITVNNGGTLRAGQNGLFGWDGTQEKPIIVNAGGTLTCDSSADVGVSTVTLGGGTLANLGASSVYGSWRFDNAGDVLSVTQDSTVSAVNVKFANGGAINVAAGRTLNFTGTITDASSGGTSSPVISGPGTVVFSGANTYTGPTMINAGRVILTNSAALASSNIVVASGATFDVAGLASTFTLGANQRLAGSGTNNGSVTTVSGARVYAGTDGGYGTNTFKQNLTLVSGAALCFDLNNSAAGANDRLVVLGNLNLNNTTFRIKAPSAGSSLDPNNDYLLATVSGTLSGTVNPTPVWDVQAGNYGAFAVMITNGNQIVLHAVAVPPIITGASLSAATAGRNDTLFISVSPTSGGNPLSTATADVTVIGGLAALPLISDGAGNFTNSAAVTPDTTFGGKNITLTVTDTGNISSATNLSLTVSAASRVWAGGSGSDNNWSSNPNWSTGAGPGWAGDSVAFAGGTRLTPLMDTNYSVTGVIFNSGASSFTLGVAASRFLTLTGSGITNNSTASQSVNIPLSLGAAQTLNAASGNLTFSQNITNNGNLLTVSGNSNTTVSAAITGTAGLVKAGTGTLTLSGTSPYAGTTTVNAGTLNVIGSLPSTNITYVGGAVGKAALTVSGTLKQKNLLIGNASGATGAVYQTAGTITVTNGGGDCLNVGNIAGGYGYYNISGGTTLASGIAVGGENNTGTGFSGTGGNGLMDVFGGTVNNTSWFVMARGDTSETGVLNVQGGLFAYAGGGMVNCWGANQTAIVNVMGGVVSNSSAVGINLNQSGNASNTGIMNLNGGTVQANSISGANARLNFNGGTLKAGAVNAAFVSGPSATTVYSNGATINNNGYAVTVSTPLLAPTGNGVNGIASFSSGAGYIAPPIITVNRGAGDTTGVGATAIAQIDRAAGTVTNIVITCPGVNYTVTPTFTLTGGGATTPATITGQPPTANTSGGFTTTGAGTLTLSGGNTYTGSTLVNGGTLRFGGPVLKMSFDNVSGTTVVNQGTGGSAMNGTLTGTATIVGGGRFGNALSIPGGDSSAAYVLVPSSVVSFNAAGNWSVGLWVKTSTAGGAYLNQGDGGWGSGNTTFYLNNGSGAGTKAGGVRWGQGWEQGTATINNGQWHFIVLTASGGVKRQFVDGALDALVTDAWNGNGTGGQLRIGGTGTGEGDGQVGLNGLIDEVYVYDRALSLAEVQQLYNANSAQPLAATTPVTVAVGANFDLSGFSQTIASLSGAGKVTNSSPVAVTLTLSNNTGTATFSGSITDQAASNAVSVVQVGSATNIFSGANSYRGTTTIRGGTFLVNGSLSTNAVTVTNGATLGGNGTINGTVTVQNNGVLSPGSGIGKLTVNSAVLQSGSTTFMEISKSPLTNDQLRVTGVLTYGGTLTVTNVSGTLAANDSFQLFSAGSTGGSFSATNLPLLNAGLAWNFNATSGVLSVVRIVAATNSTNLTFTAAPSSLTLSWPSDHTGWRLQTQTNALSVGLGTNWFDVPNSTETNSVIVPMDLMSGSIFYRLVYP